MSTPPPVPARFLVACLCAQWCGSCREYRSTFDAVAAEHPGVEFRWVDIEDEADLVDPVEVDNFPTLLIAASDGVRFFGPLLPHKETLNRLLRAQIDSSPTPLVRDENLARLARRLIS